MPRIVSPELPVKRSAATAATVPAAPGYRIMHRFIPDLIGLETPALLDPAQLTSVKTMVRGLLQLTQDTVVLITEVACADAACPLVETIIAVFPADQSPRRWKFTRPRAALTRLMLVQTLATSPEP